MDTARNKRVERSPPSLSVLGSRAFPAQSALVTQNFALCAPRLRSHAPLTGIFRDYPPNFVLAPATRRELGPPIDLRSIPISGAALRWTRSRDDVRHFDQSRVKPIRAAEITLLENSTRFDDYCQFKHLWSDYLAVIIIVT